MMLGQIVTVTRTGRKAVIVGFERDFYVLQFRNGQVDRYKGWALK